jgi:hypothetical protein
MCFRSFPRLFDIQQSSNAYSCVFRAFGCVYRHTQLEVFWIADRGSFLRLVRITVIGVPYLCRKKSIMQRVSSASFLSPPLAQIFLRRRAVEHRASNKRNEGV